MLILICPDCGDKMELRQGKYGWFYACYRYPFDCDGVHSAHQDTKEPMGIPANKETREWRKKAHAIFDAHWRKWKLGRDEAYWVMAKNMKLTKEEAHISRFNKEQCQELIRLYKRKRPGDMLNKPKKKVLLPKKVFFKKLQSKKFQNYGN